MRSRCPQIRSIHNCTRQKSLKHEVPRPRGHYSICPDSVCAINCVRSCIEIIKPPHSIFAPPAIGHQTHTTPSNKTAVVPRDTITPDNVLGGKRTQTHRGARASMESDSEHPIGFGKFITRFISEKMTMMHGKREALKRYARCSLFFESNYPIYFSGRATSPTRPSSACTVCTSCSRSSIGRLGQVRLNIQCSRDDPRIT